MSQQTYDAVIGYSALDNANRDKQKKTVQIVKTILDAYCVPSSKDMILIAGCGNGTEARLIKDVFNAKTIGVDISLDESKLVKEHDFELQKQELTALAFDSDTFSFIYSYHVLEHVPDHIKALKELHRTLKDDGVLYIGFPNKNRLIGYIGSQNNLTFIDKLKFNLTDYKQRIKGRFENRFGAHAGFTEKEFLAEAGEIFGKVIPIRNKYMLLKYKKYQGMVNLIIRLRLDELLFPSNYYICTK